MQMTQILKLAFVLTIGIVTLNLQSCENGDSKKSGITAEHEATEVSVWKYESLTDEFGDDNGERVITGIFDGKFSNSATNNSDAKLQIFYTEGAPIFRIFNYGNQSVKGENFLRFKVKDGNGNVNVLYLLNNDGFFVPTEVPGTLGMTGIDSLLRAEQNIKLSGVLLDGRSDVDCLTTEYGYLAEETGAASGYIERTEANQPKYQFSINPKGLGEIIQK